MSLQLWAVKNIVLILTKSDNRYLPVSPYTMQFGVLKFNIKNKFQKLKFTFSKGSQVSNNYSMSR